MTTSTGWGQDSLLPLKKLPCNTKKKVPRTLAKRKGDRRRGMTSNSEKKYRDDKRNNDMEKKMT